MQPVRRITFEIESNLFFVGLIVQDLIDNDYQLRDNETIDIG